MSLYIDLYLSDKKPNSTKSPSIGATLRRFTGNFREPCDVMNPVIMLEIDSIEQVQAPNYNYAYIVPFRRYYHITKMVMVTSTLVQIYMACDVLATYRTEIGNTRNYISRCSVQWDPHVVDTLQPTNCEVKDLGYTVEHEYARTLAGGAYVVGIIAPSLTSLGSVTHYVMNDDQIQELIKTLYATDPWIAGIDDVSVQLAKAIVNPMQYITSVEWFPYAPEAVVMSTLGKIGQFDIVPIPCNALSPGYATNPIRTFEMNIPFHPDIISNAINAYLQMDTYSTFTLRAAPFGEIQIPAALLYGCDKLLLDMRIDYITGVATLTGWARNSLSSADSRLVFTISAKISISINLSQVINAGMANTFRNMTSSVGGMLSGVLTMGIDAAANAFSGGFSDSARFANDPMTNIIGERNTGGISGIASAVGFAKNELRVTGTAGGGGMGALFAYGSYFYLRGRFTHISSFLDLDMYGRPLCKTATPASIGAGYYQMANPVITIHGTPAERAAILSFMSRGFYYE